MKIHLKISVVLIIIGALGVACQNKTSGEGESLEMRVQNLETFA